MAELHELISKIENPELRAQIQTAADRLVKQKKFGLVFEDHLPECTPLYDIPVRKGLKVSLRKGKANETYTVLKVTDGKAVCLPKNGTEAIEFDVADLVVTAELGEPIYPCLKPMGEVCNAPESDLWHTLIEADNYHALQMLEYLYAGKVDCIYIDPPYNSRAKDWKYNNDYVDPTDSYMHSLWLSMMQKRLEIAKRLLNPDDSVLIVTIDEKEYLHLGCLLEEMFPEGRMQMVSSIINASGASRSTEFARGNEYIFVCNFGKSIPCTLKLPSAWLGNIKNSSTEKVRWDGLMRTGADSMRADSPSLFYPIFVSKDGKRFCGVGDTVPLGISRDTVVPPEGTVAIFPIRSNGEEGRWRYSNQSLLRIQRLGYVKLGGFTPRGMAISYISEGWQKRVESGEIKVKGYNEDGSLILDDADYEQECIPNNQWAIPWHNATEQGTKLLQNIIGKRFSYPKSLYAVHDTLRFFVANKPSALIVDFFAGSGTTLHAVNLLNAGDGGRRRCIMVTNNEISDAERKDFEARGIRQGDAEWESRGIARYVTWPRTVCSIKGVDVNGIPLSGKYGYEEEQYVETEAEVFNPETGKKVSGKIYKKVKYQAYPEFQGMKMADGFPANAAFFKLGFLDKTRVSLGMQFKELLSTLWMKAGAVGRCPVVDNRIPDMLILPENKMAILNDENCFAEFAEQLAQHPEIHVVYIVTDYESSFISMSNALEGKQTYQLYRDYLDNFRINAGRNSR